jgi:SAM-dependent methyltransferase
MNVSDSYNAVAPEYAARIAGELAHKPFDRQVLEDFARRARDVPEARALPVLDIGSGPGHVARYLHDLGLHVVGVDVSPGMVREARGLNPDIEFRVADMRSLPWPDASVAAVAAPYSIIHIPREGIVAVLQELLRVLVPGGPLLVSFHIGAEVRHSDEWWDHPVNLDFVFFETAEMTGYLDEAGFTAIEAREREPYPDVEVQTRRAYIFARKPPG